MNLKTLETLYGIQAKVTKNEGHLGMRGRNEFVATSPQPIDKEMITSLQMLLGYHPGGYGNPFDINFHVKAVPATDPNALKSIYVYTWRCYASCD